MRAMMAFSLLFSFLFVANALNVPAPCDEWKCNSHGNCTFDSHGVPSCICGHDFQGNQWTGVSCNIPTCDSSALNSCNGKQGSCRFEGHSASHHFNQHCQCAYQWSGPACDIPTCLGVTSGTGCRTGECVIDPNNNIQSCTCSTQDPMGNSWTGIRCDEPTCDSRILNSCNAKGRCVFRVHDSVHRFSQHCSCSSDWTGVDCSIATCAGNHFCSGNGVCQSSGSCICSPGWTGAACDVVVPCGEYNFCSGNGDCSLVHNHWICVCQNYDSWDGDSCDVPVCVDDCQNGGTCSAPNTCTCDSSWSGPTCTVPVCNSPCLHGGSCSAPNTCSCTTRWSGDTCEDPICNSPCANGGTCSSPNTCSCTSLWSGPTCNMPVCDLPCANGGTCSAPNICNCDSSWIGPLCDEPVCDPICQNGGTCTAPNTCDCGSSLTGPTCLVPVCNPSCANGGTCFAPATCHCDGSWMGPTCEIYATQSGTTPQMMSTAVTTTTVTTTTVTTTTTTTAAAATTTTFSVPSTSASVSNTHSATSAAYETTSQTTECGILSQCTTLNSVDLVQDQHFVNVINTHATSMGGMFIYACNSLVSLRMSALTAITSLLQISSNGKLVQISFPLLRLVSGIAISSNGMLNFVLMPNIIFNDAYLYYCSNGPFLAVTNAMITSTSQGQNQCQISQQDGSCSGDYLPCSLGDECTLLSSCSNLPDTLFSSSLVSAIDNSYIKATEDYLIISANDNLLSIKLNSVTFAGGSLAIDTNSILKTLSFQALTYISSNVLIQNNAALTSIRFPSLQTIQGTVTITGNSQFLPIPNQIIVAGSNGLDQCIFASDAGSQSCFDWCTIYGPCISSSAATISYTSDVTINNPALQNVQNDLSISNCNSLMSVTFESLRQVNGRIDIISNIVLTSISLPALDSAQSIILANPNLNYISVPSLHLVQNVIEVCHNSGALVIPSQLISSGHRGLADCLLQDGKGVCATAFSPC